MPTKKRPPPPANGSKTLVKTLKRDETPAESMAAMMVGGIEMNAITALAFSPQLGDLDLTECVVALTTATRRVKAGDLSDLEALLAGQVVALNAMFTQLAHLTSRITLIDQIDRLMRLALKAQGQCRATVETLALMKNPPVFARQANIAHGPQQVNNGVTGPPAAPSTASRAVNHETAPIELLEAAGERMDLPARTSGRRDQAMAPVEARYRPPKR